MEKLEEIQEFVRCLTNDTIFMNEHASNLFHVKCRIPKQKDELLEKIDTSGLPYIVNFLNGAGGHWYGLENAHRTAQLYDGLYMTMVNTSMMTAVPGTPMYRAMEKGLYTESTETEKLEEIHEFVRCLTNDTIFMNEHASNLFHVKRRIPEQKRDCSNISGNSWRKATKKNCEDIVKG